MTFGPRQKPWAFFIYNAKRDKSKTKRHYSVLRETRICYFKGDTVFIFHHFSRLLYYKTVYVLYCIRNYALRLIKKDASVADVFFLFLSVLISELSKSRISSIA